MKASDEELIEQIKVVFDDYDDGLSEQGWTNLRKKFPEKENKKLPIWWLSGIAASLLLVLGLYFGDVFNTQKTIPQTVKNKKQESAEKPVAEPIQPQNDIRPQSDPLFENNHVAVEKTEASPKTNPQTTPLNKVNTNKAANTQAPLMASKTPVGDQPEKNITIPSVETTKNPLIVVDKGNMVATTKVENNQTAGTQIEAPKNTVEKETPATKLSTQEFFNKESEKLANNKNKTTEKSNGSNTTIDVFTGTFFNYHDNNEAKLSAGVGLNANVKVTKNLVFSFGAGISQNKVSYENKVPMEVSTSMFAAKDNALSLAPSSTVYSATATNDVSFNGQLLTIDLPMAVKFYPTKKQDFYISTGINSTSYLSQKYTYNYNWSNFQVKNGEAQQRQETEKSSLRGFDFANSAIIAIGINQNLGRNTLIFEPYYKPALGTMGDKNLRISSAGLNLKFNFNGAKK